MIIKDPITFHGIFREIKSINTDLIEFHKKINENIKKDETISTELLDNIASCDKNRVRLAFQLVEFFESYGIKIDRDYQKRIKSKKITDEKESILMTIKQIMEPTEEQTEKERYDNMMRIMNMFRKQITDKIITKEELWRRIIEYKVPYTRKRFDMDFERSDF